MEKIAVSFVYMCKRIEQIAGKLIVSEFRNNSRQLFVYPKPQQGG